jgi:hypothetical protein
VTIEVSAVADRNGRKMGKNTMMIIAYPKPVDAWIPAPTMDPRKPINKSTH